MCPSNGPATSSPVCASQIRIIMSSEPETTCLPSPENPTDLTQSVCPSNGPATSSPVCASQTRTVLSDKPETTHLPSPENPTELTLSVCPSITLRMAGQVSIFPNS